MSFFVAPACRRAGLALAACATLVASAGASRAADIVCDGEPSAVRLLISVDKIAQAQGQIAATIYPDDPHRFLRHHGQLMVVRRPTELATTQICAWLPSAARYEVAVYQDLNSDGRFNRTRLGLPAEPYGLSNDPPNLLGLPTFRSVQFSVHEGDNAIHIPLHSHVPAR